MIQIPYFPYYSGGILQMFIVFIVFFCLSIAVSIFSPLGIGFIIASLVKKYSARENTKKVCFICQIVLALILLLLGIILSFLIPSWIISSGTWSYNIKSSLSVMFAILFGSVLLFLVEVTIIILQRKK